MTNRYLFILGRNPELSRAEIISYLEAREIKFEIISEKNNLLLIEAEINSGKAINSLGGTIAIGKVLVSGSRDELIDYIEKNPIYFGSENKFSYSLIGEDEEILDAIKENFKKEKLKVNLKNPELAPEQLSGLFNYFLAENSDINFGIIEEVYNTKEAEKRDMEKPVRRSQLAISPRLAKILINLAQARENETLLDAFCGIGTIMQEALLQGVNVIGIDIDRRAINGARRNLLWLKEKYKIKSDYRLVNKDSGRLRLRNIDGIACEPNLGILLKKSPNIEQAREIIKKFERMMIFVLTNLRYSLKERGKIAFTSPLVFAGNKRIGCDINKIAEKTKLKLVSRFSEEREGKIVSREIYVLEK